MVVDVAVGKDGLFGEAMSGHQYSCSIVVCYGRFWIMRIGDTSIYFKFVSVKTNIKVGGGLGLLDQELLDCFLATILG